MSAQTSEVLGALKREGLVHVLEPHANDVWAIHCGGYTTRVYWPDIAYVTCVMCASGMDYWREE